MRLDSSSRWLVSSAVVAGVVGFSACAVLAQAPTARDEVRQVPHDLRRPAPPADAPPLRGPLAGPRLRGVDAPGVSLSFGQTGGLARQRANIRVYIEVLRTLDLSEQQEQQIRAILRDRAQAIGQVGRQNSGQPTDRVTDVAPPVRRRLNDRVPGQSGAGSDGAPPVRRRLNDRAPGQTDAAPEGAPPARRRLNDRRPGQSDAGPDAAPPVRRRLKDRRPDQSDAAPEGAPPVRRRLKDRPGQSDAGPDGAPPDGMQLRRGRRVADEEYMLQIWNVLDPAQQEAFKNDLIALARRRMMERIQRARRSDRPVTDQSQPGMDSMMNDRGEVKLPTLGELTPREERMIQRFRAQQRRIEEMRRRGTPVPPRARDLELPPAPPTRDDLNQSDGDDGG